MGNVDLSKFNNSWYNPGSKIKRLLWYFVNILFFKTSLPYPSKFKVFILKLFGAKTAKNIIIKPNVNIKYPWFLEIGNGAYILTGNHNYKKETFDLIVNPVIIEDGVWIGAKSIVCPGSVIKTHSVLSVGSVFSGISEEGYTIYRGNPATPLRLRKIT
mgnify:CR=1 FL=1